MPLKAELLINSKSRRARHMQDRLLKAFESTGLEIIHIHKITHKNPLDTAIAQVKQRKPNLLIIAGGDGTISSSLDRLTGINIEIGIIPLGTTNNFARSLDIPFELEEAVSFVKRKKARPVDLGLINGNHFTNVAGIGLSARIANGVTVTEKRRWGRFAYAYIGLRKMITQSPFIVTVRDPDHELMFSFETRQVIIANGRYHAGKIIARDAKVDNNQLVIFALGGRSISSLLFHMLDFYTGNRKLIVHSSYLVGKKVEVSTNITQPIELDGEVKLHTPAKITVERSAVKVRW